MADPTREEIAARQKAEADAAKAKADADAKARAVAAHPAAAPAAQPAAAAPKADTTATLIALAEAMQRIAPATASTATANLDETKPGGIYRVRGMLVNAHGREVNEDGSLKHPEQQETNAFGQVV